MCDRPVTAGPVAADLVPRGGGKTVVDDDADDRAVRPVGPVGRSGLPSDPSAGPVATRTDGELVEAVREGEVAAFSELYRAHGRAVQNVVRSYVREPEASADVVQEAFVRALERLPSLRQADRFRPWLLAIARHAAIDRCRAQGRLRSLDTHGVDEIASSARGPDREAELAELAELVNGCVAGLTSRDATAVAMVTHLGYSPAQVGAVLGVSPGAAKVIVHRARRRLRDALTLQLLALHRVGACATLAGLWQLDDVVGAARHVRTCQECVSGAGRELDLYALVAVPPLARISDAVRV